jgi:hypothetical protein
MQRAIPLELLCLSISFSPLSCQAQSGHRRCKAFCRISECQRQHFVADIGLMSHSGSEDG